MKRDYSLIEQVVLNQRNNTRLKFAKLYRLLKSSRKELLRDPTSSPTLKSFLEKQMKDAFDILSVFLCLSDVPYPYLKPNSETIKLQDLAKVIHLCGKEIKKDELLYLARESTRDEVTKAD